MWGGGGHSGYYIFVTGQYISIGNMILNPSVTNKS